jgi:hypothetical protein
MVIALKSVIITQSEKRQSTLDRSKSGGRHCIVRVGQKPAVMSCSAVKDNKEKRGKNAVVRERTVFVSRSADCVDLNRIDVVLGQNSLVAPSDSQFAAKPSDHYSSNPTTRKASPVNSQEDNSSDSDELEPDKRLKEELYRCKTTAQMREFGEHLLNKAENAGIDMFIQRKCIHKATSDVLRGVLESLITSLFGPDYGQLMANMVDRPVSESSQSTECSSDSGIKKHPGLVVFREVRGVYEYLLLLEIGREDNLTPSIAEKKGETSLLTAMDALQDSTGLTNRDFAVLPKFQYKMNYVDNNLVFFAAELRSVKAVIQVNERLYERFVWMSLTMARVFAKDDPRLYEVLTHP